MRLDTVRMIAQHGKRRRARRLTGTLRSPRWRGDGRGVDLDENGGFNLKRVRTRKVFCVGASQRCPTGAAAREPAGAPRAGQAAQQPCALRASG